MDLNIWDDIKDAKKAAIMKAALKEFSEKGYTKATTRNISKEANVANGLIFYYFKDKKTLYLELANHLRKVIFINLQTTTHDVKDFFERMRQLCIEKLTLSSKYPDIYKFFLEFMNLFPNEFKENGRELHSTISFLDKDEDNLLYEIAETALFGMTTRIIEKYQKGEISNSDLFDVGMSKAEKYINFFQTYHCL